MRIMLHDSYEAKLLKLVAEYKSSPSQVVKQLIDAATLNTIECTNDAQGRNNGNKQEKAQL